MALSASCTTAQTLTFKLVVLLMEIVRYKREHENAVISAINEDHNWDIFTNERAIDNYKKSLRKSITYVCYVNESFVGYLRALLDDGFAVYISELFVVPEWRNKTIGRTLIAKVKMDYKHLTVYALSDEDTYYEKLGHRKIGSVFEIYE